VNNLIIISSDSTLQITITANMNTIINLLNVRLMKLTLLVVISLFFSTEVFGQNVKGTVTSADDHSELPGVSIINQSTGKGTITDVNGKYSIQVSSGDSLLYTFMGMQPVKVVYNGEPEINIAMESSVLEVDELVLVGYSYQKKSVVTGAIASLKSEDINKTANLRVEQALQGKVAGVQIASTSGQPGEDVTVRIRGTGTTGDSDPLYIIDGFPSGSIDYLSPSDIKSIEILKDAASASIYGARGANGVVLIQTKTGDAGKMQVDYNMYYGLQNPTKKVELLDARKYAVIMNEAANNAGRPRIFENLDTLGEGTDWQEEIFYRNAPIQEHQLGISGGSENSMYSSSISYFGQDGIVGKGKSNFERYSFRMNTDQNSDKFTYGTRLYYAHIKKTGIEPNLEFGQPLAGALNIDPITPVKNEDGSWGESPYVAQEIVNPVAQLDIIYKWYKLDKIVGSIYGELEPVKNLKLKSSFGIDYAYDVDKNYQPVYRLNSTVRNDVSSVGKTMHRWFTWNWENTVKYNLAVSKHNITGLAGYSMSEHKGEDLSGGKEGLVVDSPDKAYINLAKNEDSDASSGGAWQSALMSYFGQLHYAYDEKYLLTFTIRSDGSSRFGPENRFATFPSVSAGWIISNEDYFPFNQINFMKLRLSWGQNGNQEIGDYKYTSLIIANSNYYWGIPPVLHSGAQPENVPNPEIKWETSEQTNAGVDLRFFENKFNLTVDWYKKTTKGLLVEAPIPGYIGNYSPTINAGNVKNTGIELEMGYKNKIDHFSYSVNYNISYNKNEVTYIGNTEGIIHGAGVGTSMSDVCRAEVGYPIAYFWGYETDGVFQTDAEIQAYNVDGELIQPLARPGDLKFKDTNGDGSITDEDRVMIGNPNPDVLTGLNIALEYKGFDLNIFTQGAFGYQIFKGMRRNDLTMANYSTTVMDRWLGAGSTNDHPRVTLNDQNGNFTKPSDFFIEDASYVRIKNVQFGYTFNKNMARYLFMQSLRIYLSAQNLFTFTKYTGYDPEIGARETLDVGIDRGVYPHARIFMVGANVKF
jgi:TonB-dependent starch-binding outer membrane protein SusC